MDQGMTLFAGSINTLNTAGTNYKLSLGHVMSSIDIIIGQD